MQRSFSFFDSRTLFMSQQQFIAFLSQEFLRQALKLGWIFTHVSQREHVDFPVCRLVEIKSLYPTF